MKQWIVFFLVALMLSSCGVDFTYESVRDEGFQEADKIFVGSGYCPVWGPKGNQCLDRNTMYSVMKDKGFKILIYGVKDRKLLAQVSKMFINKFAETQGMQTLIIVAYPFSKKEELPFVTRWQQGSILNIDLKRSEYLP